MILTSLAAALLRPFARRALQAENKHLRDENGKLHLRFNDVLNRLITANAMVADLQMKAERAKRTYNRVREVEKGLNAARIAELDVLKEQLAEANEELAELREQLDLSQRGGVSIAQTAKALVDAAKAEVARERRLRDQHAATCPTAAAIQDHADDKNRENAL